MWDRGHHSRRVHRPPDPVVATQALRRTRPPRETPREAATDRLSRSPKPRRRPPAVAPALFDTRAALNVMVECPFRSLSSLLFFIRRLKTFSSLRSSTLSGNPGVGEGRWAYKRTFTAALWII